MRVFRLNQSTQHPVLVETESAQPSPGESEVVIRVRAVGVTPSELLWYPTSHNEDGSARSGAVPGHEFSGEIAAIGEHVRGFSVGDAVYGMNDWYADGATAEYCVAAATSIGPKPVSLTHGQAAAVPIGALTAWQGLHDRAKLQHGERVLVHGGSGAVGVFVVQLARLFGAEVIATASARNAGFVTQLGATQVIDYESEAFEQHVRDVDVVFDCVGGDTFHRSWQVLKPGGRMVTIAADSEGTRDERAKQAFFIVEPNQSQLVEVGHLLDRGSLSVFVDAEVPFAEAANAYSRKIEHRLGYGKVVIAVAV